MADQPKKRYQPPNSKRGLGTIVNARARHAAVAELIDRHREEFDQLRAEHLEAMKVVHGWVDGRPAANKARKGEKRS